MSDCPLCDADVRTPRLYEDGVCWVAACTTCHVPMVVLRRHTIEPLREERQHMHRALTTVAKGYYATTPWIIDEVMRTIPDHAHMHARPALRFL